MPIPLAEKIRPQNLDEVVGQKHILAKDKPLYKIINSGKIPNMIFYGPSGVGKTTVARIIAERTNMSLHKLNGTSASTSDIKAVFDEIDSLAGMNGILLYLDEIQYLNKKQQQSLLEHIENGGVTLIASTTENPYFYVYNAILSRSTVFEFKAVEPEEIKKAILRAYSELEKMYGDKALIDEDTLEEMSFRCGGDVRKSMNAAELSYFATEPNSKNERNITLETVTDLSQRSGMNYDKDGDKHYDIMSALQKSVRGSDENAALHYLARLLSAGDLISACRRIMVMACEDIGLAYPQAIPIVKSCIDAALMLGMPEARIPLADAVVLLATSPKSNSAYMGINLAMEDVEKGNIGDIPRQLQNKHFDGDDIKNKGQFYLYPHDYKNHYVKQQYLPDNLKDKVYYEFGDNKTEQLAHAYREKIKKESE